MVLKEDERLDELFREKMKIIQSRSVFSFSVDALLLANFTRLTKRTKRVMDLCSGNGIIPLLLSHRTHSPIDGVEIQDRVVDMAERNIVMNGKENQISIYNVDMKEIKLHFEHSTYDTITVNPPYFTNNQPVKDKGPHSIARHEIHIDLNGVIQTARYLIKNKGRLTLVHRAERSTEVVSELHNNGFRVRRMQYVFNDRKSEKAMFVLIEAIFNSFAYVEVMQPFYIYDESGSYTKEMLEVYYG